MRKQQAEKKVKKFMAKKAGVKVSTSEVRKMERTYQKDSRLRGASGRHNLITKDVKKPK
jgi:hypothetical protein